MTRCDGCGHTADEVGLTDDDLRDVEVHNMFDPDDPHTGRVCSADCAERWERRVQDVDQDDLAAIPNHRKAHG